MTNENAKEILLNAQSFFETQSAGYKSWGEVKVLQIATRLNNSDYLSNEEDLNAEILKKIFSKRKEVNVILFTRQQYASQVKKEVPPILDDQAQLLGVSIRIAKSDKDVINALKNRFAAILPGGGSVCIGSNIEEAYVAAQLLEKTSKAFIEAEVLGGAKSINKIEAWLMQKFYQLKYSKEAKKNR